MRPTASQTTAPNASASAARVPTPHERFRPPPPSAIHAKSGRDRQGKNFYPIRVLPGGWPVPQSQGAAVWIDPKGPDHVFGLTRTDQEAPQRINSKAARRVFCGEQPDRREQPGSRVDMKTGDDVCAAHARIDEACIGGHMYVKIGRAHV